MDASPPRSFPSHTFVVELSNPSQIDSLLCVDAGTCEIDQGRPMSIVVGAEVGVGSFLSTLVFVWEAKSWARALPLYSLSLGCETR